jgi:Flp pilus assembly pilin Flp
VVLRRGARLRPARYNKSRMNPAKRRQDVMEQYTEFFNRIVKEEEGQDIIEYVMLLGFISIVAFAAIRLTGTSISGVWTAISDKVAQIPGA